MLVLLVFSVALSVWFCIRNYSSNRRLPTLFHCVAVSLLLLSWIKKNSDLNYSSITEIVTITLVTNLLFFQWITKIESFLTRIMMSILYLAAAFLIFRQTLQDSGI
ncbi:hypothetical protein LIHA111178_05810 [Litorimonas haliclonae]